MTDWIKDVVESFSYAGIAFLMFLENVFPPIPSELIMPLAGFVSSEGELSLAGVIIAGTIGSIAGAIPFFGLGRALGEERLRAWLERHGAWLGLSGEDLDKAKHWFDRYGPITVLLGRLIPGVRSLISVPAGCVQMGWLKFLSYTTIGSTLWTAALAGAGRGLGSQYERVEGVLGPVSIAVLSLILVAFIARVIRQRRRTRRPA